MGLRDLSSAAAVERALAEFDRLGRQAFLDRYGFGPARSYFVVCDGKRYDSKAIAGAAHGYQHGTPLTAQDFSGGESTVAARLGRLGFTVDRPVGLPDWAQDELLLALDFYLRTRGRVPMTGAIPRSSR